MVLRHALKKTTVVAAVASTAFVLFCISATTISGVQGCDHHHGHAHVHHGHDHAMTEQVMKEDEEEVIDVEQEGRSLRVRLPNAPPKGVTTVKGQQQQTLKNKKGGGGGRGRGSIQRCGTREPTTKEVRMIQANLAEYGKKRRELRQRQMKEQQQQQQENDSNSFDRYLQEDDDETIIMDVYFHIITDSEGNGDVTDEQVQTQIQIMNDVFSGTNSMSPSCDGSTPKGSGIKAPFQFNLKEIERVANDAWFGTSPFDEQEMRFTLHKGDCTTLNLYSRKYDDSVGLLLGWSSFPWEGCPSDGTTDAYKFQGISLNRDTLPGVAPDLIAPFDQGITLPHEMGHYLGLFHTFQTTGVFGSCYGIGDGIADTTPGIVSSSGCNKLLDTCPGVSGYDAVQNVMNYSDDCCMETFTPMQIEEMISAYYKYLKGEPLPDDPPIVVGEGEFPVITFP